MAYTEKIAKKTHVGKCSTPLSSIASTRFTGSLSREIFIFSSIFSLNFKENVVGKLGHNQRSVILAIGDLYLDKKKNRADFF